MLGREENEQMTKVGRGTLGGELLRRYWWPIAATAQLRSPGTLPVTVLGESLVLYRDRSGTLGLVAERCPHRGAGMLYGVPEQEGLRCAYHGWRFGASGRCLEQPYEQTEDPHSTFKDRVRIQAYPVQPFAGLVWAYLGPPPAPLIPRWDLFTLQGVAKEIGTAVIPCNWLQIVENALDPVHVEWLHRHFCNYVAERLDRPELRVQRLPHELIGFSEFEYGIIKRRLLEGDTEEHERWSTGHPLVFPTMLKSGSRAHPVFQLRTPIDDARTLYFWYSCHPGRACDGPDDDVPPFFTVPVPDVDADGLPRWSLLDNNSGQDIAMWVTQGPIADRSNERLGLSDKGLILYRKLLKENLERVQRGQDPMNTFRDAERNACIDLPVEEDKTGFGFRKTGNVMKYNPSLEASVARAPVPVAPSPKR